MRLSGPMPWKPAITATWPCSRRLRISSPSISAMRAAPCTPSVLTVTCQPVHERAGMPISCSTMARSPAVTCSPDATTASYSRASWTLAASRHQPASLSVVPAMAETTTATWCPAFTSRSTWRATLRILSISATEVPPNFMTSRPISPIPQNPHPPEPREGPASWPNLVDD